MLGRFYMSEICTSKIFGGLGNAMFQISIGLSYSKDKNKDYMIFNNCFEHTSHIPNITYFDNIFKKIKRINGSYNDLDYRLIQENDHSYNEIDDFDGNVCFNGYFQSFKHFQHNKEHILNHFTTDNYNLDDDYCSVHIRRGDYLSYPDVYEIMDMNYYNNAMQSMGDKKFIIISNDNDWCFENFKGYRNIKILEETDPYKILSLMASCKNHIISNSTFSWWGAYLSSSDNVICPKKWFKRGYIPRITKKTYEELIMDMLPKNWTML